MYTYIVVHVLAFIISFLLGVTLHSLFQELLLTQVLIICTTVLISLVTINSKKSITFVIIFVAFISGFYRFHVSLSPMGSTILHDVVKSKKNITLEGIIVSQPLENNGYQKFIFEVRKTPSGFLPDDVSTRIAVSSGDPLYYDYGDTVSINGVIRIPEPFETDNGRIFDYKTFLFKDGIYYTSSRVKIDYLTQEFPLTVGQKVVKKLYSIKSKYIKRADGILPQPHSGLLAGILYGQKNALPKITEENFRVVGLTHIIVLSGYNVSLVIQLFLGFLRFLPLGYRSFLALLGIIAFALLVGAGPTVIRASVMAVFLIMAKIVGRPYNVVNAMIAALFIMVIMNPWILIFDLSFQLSFLATAGLIVFSPIIERYFSVIPTVFEFRNSLVATISAQIAVTPLILYTIGEFSIISPLVNTLVLFSVPFAMLFGFLLSSIFGVFSLIEVIIFHFSYFSLHYILIVVDFFSKFPHAVLTVPKFPFILVIFSYILIIFWCNKEQKKLDNQ